MLPVEKPGTPEELVHTGVKGMKWGVRKSPVAAKFNKKYPDSRTRDSAIRLARSQNQLRFTKAVNANRTGTKKQREAARLSYLKNPDRATALRLTKGEKVAFTILAVALPVAGTAGVGLGLGIRTATRRSIEKRQYRKAYN